MTEWMNKVHFGDCLDTLRRMPAAIVNTCVTSPPYYGLRDYGHAGQMGLEETPEAFVAKLVEVFREVRRVLSADGTCWVNMGDSYAGSWGAQGHGPSASSQMSRHQVANHPKRAQRTGTIRTAGVKPKDLYGIPWLLAFALRAGFSRCSTCDLEQRSDLWPMRNGHRVCIECLLVGRTDSKVVQTEPGWYLRQDVIWHKPNPMPESIADRCTKSHEYLFLLAKSERYYFDQGAISEHVAEATIQRLAQDVEGQAGSLRVPGKTNGAMKAVAPKYSDLTGQNSDGPHRTKAGLNRRNSFARTTKDSSGEHGQKPQFREDREPVVYEGRRNKRSVWTVSTKPYSGAHFATFPPDLIEPCILAGAPAGGVVLDPFMGSGTTAMVSTRLGRQWIGCELNPEYEALQQDRLSGITLGLGFA